MRASMQVTTASLRLGGRGRWPFVKAAAYCALAASMSATLVMLIVVDVCLQDDYRWCWREIWDMF